MKVANGSDHRRLHGNTTLHLSTAFAACSVVVVRVLFHKVHANKKIKREPSFAGSPYYWRYTAVAPHHFSIASITGCQSLCQCRCLHSGSATQSTSSAPISGSPLSVPQPVLSARSSAPHSGHTATVIGTRQCPPYNNGFALGLITLRSIRSVKTGLGVSPGTHAQSHNQSVVPRHNQGMAQCINRRSRSRGRPCH